jgi:hypothetical protein
MRPVTADRLFQATVAHPALWINSFKSITWFGKHSSKTVIFSRRMTVSSSVLFKDFKWYDQIPLQWGYCNCQRLILTPAGTISEQYLM